MKYIDGGICAVKGVTAWGVKEGKYGLALIRAEGSAAGVFTRNRVIAAPLVLTRQHLEGGKLSAVIVNSGNANAFTGEGGLEDSKAMAALAANRLGIDAGSMGVASTGVIGRRLDMNIIQSQLDPVTEALTHNPEGSTHCAKAIMTTDTFSKEAAVELSNGIRIGAIAKGSGMIEPNMGTMLAFICTDAALDAGTLKQCLLSAVDTSFNMVVVDGDTSTNDMALITATGQSGTPDIDEFQAGLDRVCTLLARMIARDGEGATRLIEARVTGAASSTDAVLVAKAIVRSPLVKSAVFGRDPNWGRVIAAVGYSGAQVEPEVLSLAFANQNTFAKLVEGGDILEVPMGLLKEIMGSEEIIIHVDLKVGSGSATAWGCDLSYDYVRINAEYTT
ncbi:MAG: bifunctional ornithine acetyltransferase/N-acetylglutamate synthase [ANME-2 cluster archaeon]|nr:bifunctional ornithine acetyltransferase/N-acetylglutamate synthase [ANME-2 cluster archaeon]